jgi:hypothetical protein
MSATRRRSLVRKVHPRRRRHASISEPLGSLFGGFGIVEPVLGGGDPGFHPLSPAGPRLQPGQKRRHVGRTNQDGQQQGHDSQPRRHADARAIGPDVANDGGEFQAHHEKHRAFEDQLYRAPVLRIGQPVLWGEKLWRVVARYQAGDDGRHQPGRAKLLSRNGGEEGDGEGDRGVDRCFFDPSPYQQVQMSDHEADDPGDGYGICEAIEHAPQ